MMNDFLRGLEISVCIFALNPNPETFPQVAKALQSQCLDYALWEIVIVDNGSKIPINYQYESDFAWHPNLRYVIEPHRGFQFVHKRAIIESKGRLIVILADDCILDENYLSNALELFANHTDVGVFTGKISYNVASDLKGIGKQMNDVIYASFPFSGYFQTAEHNRYTPALRGSAGMVLRREVGTVYLTRSWIYDEISKAIQKGDAPVSLRGTDLDLPMCALYSGYQIARSDELNMVHLSQSTEITLNKLARLAYQIGYFEEFFLMRWGWRSYPLKLIPEMLRLLRNGLIPQKAMGRWFSRVLTSIGRIRAIYFLSKHQELVNQVRINWLCE